MTSRPVGSIIGAIAGLAFVLLNAGAVPGSLIWRLAAVAAFTAIMWRVVWRVRVPAPEPPSRAALRTYGTSVVAMVVAIPLGASVIINVLDTPNAVLVWVVFVVGAHFWPFGQAFNLPVFRWLSASLVVVSIVGAIPALGSNSATAAGWTGVLAGFILMLFSALGPRLSRHTPPRATG